MLVVNPPLHDVLPLFRALHNFHVCLSPHIYHAEGSDAEYIAHLNKLRAQGATIYAQDAGWGLVAYLLAIPEDVPTDALRRGGKRFKIDHLYIAPTHRRARLGHHLVAAMESDMRQRGIRRWIVAQDATNTAATDFYVRVGAEPSAIFLTKYL